MQHEKKKPQNSHPTGTTWSEIIEKGSAGENI